MLGKSLSENNQIPTMSATQRRTLFGGSSYQDSLSCLIEIHDASKSNDFIMMQALYHIGAVLINSGAAYLDHSSILNDDPSFSLSKLQAQQREKLVIYYSVLSSANLSNYDINSFLPVFVIRVALDHLEQQLVMRLITLLQKTRGENMVVFPNGGSFSVDVLAALLTTYAISNPRRFPSIYKQGLVQSTLYNISPELLASCAQMLGEDEHFTAKFSVVLLEEKTHVDHVHHQKGDVRNNLLLEQKAAIIAILQRYTQFNKISYFTRQHLPEATKLVSDIKAATDLAFISDRLMVEKDFLAADASRNKADAPLAGSGYYRVINDALEKATELLTLNVSCLNSYS